MEDMEDVSIVVVVADVVAHSADVKDLVDMDMVMAMATLIGVAIAVATDQDHIIMAVDTRP